MRKIKPNIAVLAVLLLGSLLALYFAYRYGRLSGANAVLSAPAAAAPAAPAAGIPVIKKKMPARRGVNRGGAGVMEMPVEKRKKRVSTLAEPGEALIGGASSVTANAAAGSELKSK